MVQADLYTEIKESGGVTPHLPATITEAIESFKLAESPPPGGGPGVLLHLDDGGEIWRESEEERMQRLKVGA
jgi:hypothetical protein